MKTARLEHLLAQGDWACSIGDSMLLRDVCEAIAKEGPAELAPRYRSVMRLSVGDMWTAVEEWGDLAKALQREKRPGAGPDGSSFHKN